MTDATLRSAIIAEIMKLVRPARVALDPRPSIAEIEKMINAEQDIRTEPDGSVSVPDQHPRTAGDIADAVLRVVATAAHPEVSHWRADAAARLEKAMALLAHATRNDDLERAADIRVHDIMPTLAAFRDADAGEWHSRCEICGEFLPDAEPYTVIGDDGDTSRVHTACCPEGPVYEGEPPAWIAETVAKAKALVS